MALRLVGFVPHRYLRLCQVVPVAENAEAGGAEHEVTAASRFEPEPAGREHPQDVRAGKYQDVASDGANALDYAVGPRSHLVRGFASRSAVAEQEPTRSFVEDVGGTAGLLLALIPFGPVGNDLRQDAAPAADRGPPDGARRA